jgi:hypothetical protein
MRRGDDEFNLVDTWHALQMGIPAEVVKCDAARAGPRDSGETCDRFLIQLATRS